MHSPVCLVCHTNPDPDSILSFYLCKEIIRHGWKRVDEIPKALRFLISLIDEWDTGRFSRIIDETRRTVMLAYLGKETAEHHNRDYRWEDRIQWLYAFFDAFRHHWDGCPGRIAEWKTEVGLKRCICFLGRWATRCGFHRRSNVTGNLMVLRTFPSSNSIDC
jgi:hypothetical protein